MESCIKNHVVRLKHRCVLNNSRFTLSRIRTLVHPSVLICINHIDETGHSAATWIIVRKQNAYVIFIHIHMCASPISLVFSLLSSSRYGYFSRYFFRSPLFHLVCFLQVSKSITPYTFCHTKIIPFIVEAFVSILIELVFDICL